MFLNRFSNYDVGFLHPNVVYLISYVQFLIVDYDLEVLNVDVGDLKSIVGCFFLILMESSKC